MTIKEATSSKAFTEVEDYIDREERRLLVGSPGEPQSEFASIARTYGAVVNPTGSVTMVIDPQHGPYRMDPTTLCQVAVTKQLKGRLRLNPSRSDSEDETYHLVPELRFPTKEKVSLYRLIIDPRRGQKVLELKPGGDHHNLLPEALDVTFGTPGNPVAKKYKHGRLDFIGMALRQLEVLREDGSGVPCGGAALERLLRKITEVGDLRRHERLARRGSV